ncbi:hypothetical protein AGR5A_Lc30010 [Agrobacterium genomosp. 5 str. CFBP 6626]|nr:hypothetical protein AGR5A_Lc30010 [Agrobacterium genomosp. 5 str. CFBP 6626]
MTASQLSLKAGCFGHGATNLVTRTLLLSSRSDGHRDAPEAAVGSMLPAAQLEVEPELTVLGKCRPSANRMRATGFCLTA